MSTKPLILLVRQQQRHSIVDMYQMAKKQPAMTLEEAHRLMQPVMRLQRVVIMMAPQALGIPQAKDCRIYDLGDIGHPTETYPLQGLEPCPGFKPNHVVKRTLQG
jgi:hypothetical protein